jgi:prevent-host-death family protein
MVWITMMERIAISKFKATCLGVIERVRKTRRPVLVTKFGKPVAQVSPAPEPEGGKRRLGGRAGTGRIVGDIVGPVSDESDWETLNS